MNLPYYGNKILCQAANLWRIKQKMSEELVASLLPSGSFISIIDGFPMPVSGFKRAHLSWRR